MQEWGRVAGGAGGFGPGSLKRRLLLLGDSGFVQGGSSKDKQKWVDPRESGRENRQDLAACLAG